MVSEKCRIDTELLPSLFLRCTTDPLRREKYPAVTHLKFLTRENSEQVRPVPPANQTVSKLISPIKYPNS